MTGGLAVLARYWKGLVGLIAPALPLLVVGLSPDSPGGSSLIASEVVGIVAACVVTGGAVTAAPRNRSRDEAGVADAGAWLLVVAIGAAVLAFVGLMAYAWRTAAEITCRTAPPTAPAPAGSRDRTLSGKARIRARRAHEAGVASIDDGWQLLLVPIAVVVLVLVAVLTLW